MVNEKAMNKDRSFVESTNPKVETEKKEFAEFEENSDNEGEMKDR